ncbi:hypothetical protein ACIBCT_06550 [Streptosporangium sp. NPDC050855]|uniref:hypothetical protein n=1 Tax=Streptosporangium sp. NPDC050855 TaxID=3366194 RepID=UPI0037AB2670
MSGLVAAGVQDLAGCGVVAGGHGQVTAQALVQGGGVEFLDQAAVVNDADAGGRARDLGQQVAGQEHRDAVFAGQAGQQGTDLHDADGIQAVDGLVQDEQVGRPMRALARARRCRLPMDRVRARRSA